ncbi:MAG: hypothetical protein FVQ79_04235 [Planctomycetes bacterium]|nr:hypothetical protein [Planctomycetota bacterium]
MTRDARLRRERILDFIIEYKRNHDGCSPTTRQIMKHCDISSTSVAAYHLNVLEHLGKIRRSPDRHKLNIEVIGGIWDYKPVVTPSQVISSLKGPQKKSAMSRIIDEDFERRKNHKK